MKHSISCLVSRCRMKYSSSCLMYYFLVSGYQKNTILCLVILCRMKYSSSCLMYYFWCLNIRWNTLYRVWYVTSGVLISDETLLLVFDALLLGVWTSNKTLLFTLIRYPGILCQIQNSFSCLVYSFLVFGHKMNNCFCCLLDIFIFWYQVKYSFLCLIYRLIYKQTRNSFDDGKAGEKD